VRDGRDRRLEPRDVPFERDRHFVAEAALDARADRAKEPRGRRGHAERDCGDPYEPAVALQDSLAEQLEPEGKKRIRKGADQREKE
jgi:hypothetical protein